MGREVMTQAEVRVSYCVGVGRGDVRGLRSGHLFLWSLLVAGHCSKTKQSGMGE